MPKYKVYRVKNRNKDNCMMIYIFGLFLCLRNSALLTASSCACRFSAWCKAQTQPMCSTVLLSPHPQTSSTVSSCFHTHLNVNQNGKSFQIVSNITLKNSKYLYKPLLCHSSKFPFREWIICDYFSYWMIICVTLRQDFSWKYSLLN